MIDTEAESSETLRATRNAFKLGGSLVLTWSIAIAMRFLLPRFLGPERFGALSFADAFTTTFFIALGLGVDVYVRKKVSVRPAHASDFLGGTFVLRLGLSLVVFALMAVVMRAMGTAPEHRLVVYLFAVAQLFVVTNATLSALLHAEGTVGGMSVLSVVTKVLWALGTLLWVVVGTGLAGLAVAFLLSELVKSVALYVLARRHLGLVFRVDLPATRAMVIFSLPYYLNNFASSAYGKLDVTLLAVISTSREVGFYASASSIAGLSLLATPLIGWVLMPTLARAAARSTDELFGRIRRSAELILSVAIPASLLIVLFAELGIRTLFGDAFAPAALALQILAPTFVVTYVSIVFAISLMMLDKPWTLTFISIAGLGVNVALNLLLVRPSLSLLGDGGGGAGCALAMLGTELFVAAAMLSVVGLRVVDRRTVEMLGKSLVACAIVVMVDRLALGLGWARLVLDLLVYALVVIGSGALRVREIGAIIQAALRRDERAGVRPVTASGLEEPGGAR